MGDLSTLERCSFHKAAFLASCVAEWNLTGHLEEEGATSEARGKPALDNIVLNFGL